MHKDIDITAIREKSGWFLYEIPGLIHEMVIFQKNCTELVVEKLFAFPIETARAEEFRSCGHGMN